MDRRPLLLPDLTLQATLGPRRRLPPRIGDGVATLAADPIALGTRPSLVSLDKQPGQHERLLLGPIDDSAHNASLNALCGWP